MADLNIGFSAVATGTSDVITATYSPAITLSDQRIVFLRTTTPNTTTTPTLNPNSLGAQVVKGKGGATLKIGEIVGDCILMYHTSGTYWELLNSTPFLDATSSIQTQLNAKNRTADFFFLGSSPILDANTYYWGTLSASPAATTVIGWIPLRAGVITGAIIQVHNAGTVPTSENAQLDLVHDDVTVTSLIASDFKINANRNFFRYVSGLNITVADGGSLMKLTAPGNYITNSTGTQIRLTLLYA